MHTNKTSMLYRSIVGLLVAANLIAGAGLLARSARSDGTDAAKAAATEVVDTSDVDVGGDNAGDLTNVLSFAAVAALLVMSPGPNGLLISRTVPTSGRAAGFANIAGFVSAFHIHGALSILGISAILLASSTAFVIVKAVGAAYLFWIGFKALRDAFSERSQGHDLEVERDARTVRAAFVEGLFTNVLNPKTSIFYLAAFPQFITVGDGAAASAYLLVLVHTVVNVAWFGTMVFLFARLTKLVKSQTFQRRLDAITGAVFVGFSFKLAFYSP